MIHNILAKFKGGIKYILHREGYRRMHHEEFSQSQRNIDYKYA